MPNYTAGSTRVTLSQQQTGQAPSPTDLTSQLGSGAVVLDSRRTRPYWFDGRFLAAADLEREQNYFLVREADLGQGSGFEGVHGLMVEPVASSGQGSGTGTVVIRAGYGVTPAGELVVVSSDLTIRLSDLPVENNASPQPAPSNQPAQSALTRTGLYVIALQPVEYDADPITAYPTTVQGPRTAHDGDIVAATAVSLIPYPNPTGSYPAGLLQAALARQIFVTGNGATLSDALLPLAVVSLNQGAIQWIDPYLVRRESGSLDAISFGLTDPAAQQAHLMQYDMQLQAAVAARQASGLKANFAAAAFFQALPPAGRFPLDGIDTNAFSHVFFPQQMDVRLSVIPADELAALLADSMSLPPIDLTLPDNAYSNMTVIALIPVPRANFAALKSSLPGLPPNPILAQVLANRSPLELLQLYQGNVAFTTVPPVSNNAWAAAIGSQQYGYYLRQSGDSTPVTFVTPPAVTTNSLPNGEVGLAYSQTLQATGGTPPYGSWTVSKGALPPGLSLNASTGVISGTPATITGSPFAFSVTVEDSVGNISPAKALSIAIGEVTVTTNTLPGGEAGVAYSQTLAATGGTPPYGSWTVASGALPGGLTLSASNGVISGTPTTAGTASFSVTVKDSAGETSPAHPLSIAIVEVTTTTTTAKPTTTSTTTTTEKPTTTSTTTTTENPTTTSTTTTSTTTTTAKPTTTSTTTTTTTTTAKPTTTSTTTTTAKPTTTSTSTTTAKPTTTSTTTTTAKPTTTSTTTTTAKPTTTSTTTTTAKPTTTTQKPITTPTSLSVTSSLPNGSNVGQEVVFTAKVSPSAATGTVTLLEGSTTLGTGSLDGGVATIPFTFTSVGNFTIAANYGGDGTKFGASTANITQRVIQGTVTG